MRVIELMLHGNDVKPFHKWMDERHPSWHYTASYHARDLVSYYKYSKPIQERDWREQYMEYAVKYPQDAMRLRFTIDMPFDDEDIMELILMWGVVTVTVPDHPLVKGYVAIPP